jgi:hypothetical protein
LISGNLSGEQFERGLIRTHGPVPVRAQVAEREPHDLGQCSLLHMGSLEDSNIGDERARDLGAALLVNTTLTKLQ